MKRIYHLLFLSGILSSMFLCAQAETLGEKIANSEKIYYVKFMPTKVLVQFKNYNQSPGIYEPSFFEDKIHPMEIVTFKSSYDEMKFIYENEISAEQADLINDEILDYFEGLIGKNKIEVITPDKFKESFAINSVYIQPEFAPFIFVEHTNDDEFHYVSMNTFKADFGINLYEVPEGKKKKRVVSSGGSGNVLKEVFGSNGYADNVEKAQALDQLLDDYFYYLDFDFDWHFDRFKKAFEKNLAKQI
ncbi:MAG: hypothetical protein RIC80_04625 [Cyclobacteriaceae bacterium]